jgi:hypothetical protein
LRINYNSGGFFKLNAIRLCPVSEQIADYQILIKSTDDRTIHNTLKDLNNKSEEFKYGGINQHPAENQSRIQNKILNKEDLTELSEIASEVNGIGRLVQYRLRKGEPL